MTPYSSPTFPFTHNIFPGFKHSSSVITWLQRSLISRKASGLDRSVGVGSSNYGSVFESRDQLKRSRHRNPEP